MPDARLQPEPDTTDNDRPDCGYTAEELAAAPEVEIEDDDA